MATSALSLVSNCEPLALVPNSRCKPTVSELIMAGADLIALGLAQALGMLVSHILGGTDSTRPFWLLVLLSSAGLTVLKLYPAVRVNAVAEIRRLTSGLSLVYAALVAMDYRRMTEAGFIGAVIVMWASSIVFMAVARNIVRSTLSRREWWGYPVVILGPAESAGQFVRSIARHPESGLKPAGIFDDNSAPGSAVCGVPVMGGIASAAAIAKARRIHCAAIAMPELPGRRLLRVFQDQTFTFREVLIVPGLTGLPSARLEFVDLPGVVALDLRRSLLLPGARITKHVTDAMGSSMLILLALPLFALLAALILLESPGPVLYGHWRIGRNNRRFRVWKFRSMVADADRVLREYLVTHSAAAAEWKRDHKLKEDPRITRIGTFLRKTSLDELPQLWNVLKRDMSLVGPRPIVQAEVMKYGKGIGLYTQVLPGLTGLWQVSGRNNTTYEERVDLDSFYVLNWSPWLDFYLLAKTVRVVLLREGAY